MPCYFVSSGVEIPMTNEAFDFISNNFGNKELTDSETSSSSEEGATKQVHLLIMLTPMLNGESRRTDTTTENRTTKNISKRYYQEKTKQPCVCDICGSAMSCKSNLAKHKKTKKCQRFSGLSSL